MEDGGGYDDAKDPRAGGVDVTIPQLQIDCAALAETLLKAGGQKGVGHGQRAALYRLTKQFKSLAEGRWVLCVQYIVSNKLSFGRLPNRKFFFVEQGVGHVFLQNRVNFG